jgi:stage III sporulation protein AG
VVKRLYPSFGGAVIVCEGAGNSLVELEITKAVSALTGLSTDKIAVLPMKTP